MTSLVIFYDCAYRYFFPGSVLLHMDTDETAEPIEHEVEFFNIMEVGKKINVPLSLSMLK